MRFIPINKLLEIMYRARLVPALLAATLPVLGCVDRRPVDDQERAVAVRRDEVEPTITAAGVTTCSNTNMIKCGVERLKAGDQGRELGGGASTVILSVVANGAAARKGDVLCRLDSSAHEDEAVRQRIVVEGARADWNKTRLDLEVARGAFKEYREGRLVQQSQGCEARIALGRSEVLTLANRLEWLKRMSAKGYASKAQLSQCEGGLLAAELDLDRTVLEHGNLERFGAPAASRTLEARIEGAKATFAYRTGRLRLLEQRLARLERGIALCTVRSPSDAVVVHANRPKKDFVVAPGAPVRFNQDLFELTDPSQVEVEVMLHETVIGRVRPGMAARIRLEDSRDRILAGRLTSVSWLPLQDRSKYSRNETAYYSGRIVFDGAALGVRVGVSAEVEIATGRRSESLLVPDGRSLELRSQASETSPNRPRCSVPISIGRSADE